MPATTTKIHQVDVLVAGAGPSGLATALLLVRAGVRNIAIIDRSPIRVQVGHASGLQPRTLEILTSMSVGPDFTTAAGGFAEAGFWVPSDTGDAIKRSTVVQEVVNAGPFSTILIQHQGRTEEIFNKELNERGVQVRRPCELLDYEYIEDEEYPVVGYVKAAVSGEIEQYQCKYLVGAGGVHSGIQELAGISSSVNQTEDVWLVSDAEVDTDFPDIRRRCAIRTSKGNLMLIPSPHMTVRVYMLLRDEDIKELEDSRFEAHHTTRRAKHGRTALLDIYQKRLPEITKPYHMEIKNIEWISMYSIAQRVLNEFTDGKRVWFVGDSCHSHSPKAGQGMNTGIQDAYNLAWKLAFVLRGRAKSELLKTYNDERNRIAHQLIEFDEEFAKRFAESGQDDFDDFSKFWQGAQGFTSGLQHQYPDGLLVKQSENAVNVARSAVEPLTPGKRLLPMSLIRHIDGIRVSSMDVMPANGQFQLIMFAGDISQEPRHSEFKKLYDSVTSTGGVLSRYNGQPPGDASGWPFEDVNTNCDISGNPSSTKVINLHVVHTAAHADVEMRPNFEMWKYTFFEDAHGEEHKSHGIDPEGPIVGALVRPDGFIGLVQDAGDELAQSLHAYLAGFMHEAKA